MAQGVVEQLLCILVLQFITLAGDGIYGLLGHGDEFPCAGTRRGCPVHNLLAAGGSVERVVHVVVVVVGDEYESAGYGTAGSYLKLAGIFYVGHDGIFRRSVLDVAKVGIVAVVLDGIGGVGGCFHFPYVGGIGLCALNGREVDRPECACAVGIGSVNIVHFVGFDEGIGGGVAGIDEVVVARSYLYLDEAVQTVEVGCLERIGYLEELLVGVQFGVILGIYGLVVGILIGHHFVFGIETSLCANGPYGFVVLVFAHVFVENVGCGAVAERNGIDFELAVISVAAGPTHYVVGVTVDFDVADFEVEVSFGFVNADFILTGRCQRLNRFEGGRHDDLAKVASAGGLERHGAVVVLDDLEGAGGSLPIDAGNHVDAVGGDGAIASGCGLLSLGPVAATSVAENGVVSSIFNFVQTEDVITDFLDYLFGPSLGTCSCADCEQQEHENRSKFSHCVDV